MLCALVLVGPIYQAFIATSVDSLFYSLGWGSGYALILIAKRTIFCWFSMCRFW